MQNQHVQRADGDFCGRLRHDEMGKYVNSEKPRFRKNTITQTLEIIVR